VQIIHRINISSFAVSKGQGQTVFKLQKKNNGPLQDVRPLLIQPKTTKSHLHMHPQARSANTKILWTQPARSLSNLKWHQKEWSSFETMSRALMTRSMKHAVKQQFRTSLRSQGEERLSYQRTEHYLMPLQYHKSWFAPAWDSSVSLGRDCARWM